MIRVIRVIRVKVDSIVDPIVDLKFSFLATSKKFKYNPQSVPQEK